MKYAVSDICAFIDGCPSDCGLIKALFAEVEACCRSCSLSATDDGCPEECLTYRLLKLAPANFDFGKVCVLNEA